MTKLEKTLQHDTTLQKHIQKKHFTNTNTSLLLFKNTRMSLDAITISKSNFRNYNYTLFFLNVIELKLMAVSLFLELELI